MEERLKEKYIFYEEIGSGGSGKVFKAYDRHLQCPVAIKKFLAGDGISDRELGMLKDLRHPAFPAVTDYMEENGYKYLVMEYIEGRNLADYIREKGAVGQGQAARWAMELAEVLIYLHERECPVIYRDMKPANIMIDEKGHVRLVDFGTAFLRYQEAQKACAGGTWGYAAPEQFEANCGRTVDERSDIYGLGATLFHMLTGCDPSRPPFLMQPIRFYDRRLSAGLEKVVKKAVQPEKEKRYSTVRSMKRELENYGKADRIRRYMENAGKTVYGLALAGSSISFLGLWAWIEEEAAGRHGNNMAGQAAVKGMGTVRDGLAVIGGRMAAMGKAEAEERLLLAAALILLLCLGKSLVSRFRYRGYRGVRQEKNVLLTMKKGKGLVMGIFLGILAAWLPLGQNADVWAKGRGEETALFVVVRNGQGQKLLIRYDAEYALSETLRLEIPLQNFDEGEHYELRLECINKGTGEAQGRTFYLKGVEP